MRNIANRGGKRDVGGWRRWSARAKTKTFGGYQRRERSVRISRRAGRIHDATRVTSEREGGREIERRNGGREATS